MKRVFRFVMLVLVTAGLLPVAAVQAQDAAPETEVLPPAREILDRYVKNVGGEEAIRAHTSRHATGTMEMPAQGITGTLDVFAAAPDLFSLRINIPGMGDIVSGFDGENGWIIQPMTGPMLLEGDALEGLKDQADFYDVLKAGEFKVLETVGSEEIDGKDCWKIKVVESGDRETFEFYDKKSGMAVASEGPHDTPMGVIMARTRILEHTEFGGVLYPSKLSQEVMGMEQLITVDVTDFEPIDPAVFQMPAEIKVLSEEPAPSEEEAEEVEEVESGGAVI